MPAESPLNQSFSHYLKYWLTLEPTTMLPHISTIFDTPDAQIHPWLSIVDVDDDAIQPIRFAGTHLVNYFGQDFTRTNFLDVLSAQARPIILQAHHEIVGRPCGAYLESLCTTATGRESKFLAMGLPLIRSPGHTSVAWLLEPDKTVTYGEVRVLVHRVTQWQWIDLGHGRPTT